MYCNQLRIIRLFLSLIVLFFCLACSAKSSSIPERPDQLGLEEIQFSIRKPERWVMPNGLIVLYEYDDEVPLVYGNLYLPGGALYESADVVGLASATGSQMREGSVKGIAPDALDQRLDDLGAVIESSYGSEFGTVGFSCLSEDIDEVFSFFSQIVREPVFDKKRFQLWQRLALEGIKRRRDNPDLMASMAFEEILFGSQSPYARSPSITSINNITQEKMKTFHSLFVRPDGARLAISGSIPKAKLKILLEKHFSKWVAMEAELPKLPELSGEVRPAIYVLKRDFDQVRVIIGHRGPPRHTEDRFSIAIYNEIFGSGSFNSTLFQEIRTKLGLAYTVYGGLFPGPLAGEYQVYMGTRTSEVLEAIKSALRLIKVSTEVPPQENQFKEAVSSIERGFVFKFSDSNSIVNRQAYLEHLGYPDDYNETFLERLGSVTPKAVQSSAQHWIKPNDLAIIVVGNINALELKSALRDSFEVYSLDFDDKPEIGGRL